MSPRLKSLELHGYKTFANRTVFEFPGSVTAIVGPNGSGKSNIADALRWVLGEQSYSLLRGRKTEDMIFAGSEQRPRAGLAEATLVFENSDQWLPIDFSEVAISRRAYRDGANEYFLNGHRVRLRDVSELLSQSGLAERTYTIIGQGLVDAALALKAEERRQLFEEAAGIGLHRSRREEALRRLETTLRNLERVEDILAELKPRLHSLEKQAKRTQEYEQVRADLRLSMREWYGYHWHRAQAEMAQFREASRLQDQNLESARKAHAMADATLNQYRENLSGMRAQLNQLHHQAAELHTRRERLNLDLAVNDERIKALRERFEIGQADLARRMEESGQLEERIRLSREEVDRFDQEWQERKEQAAEAEQALAGRLAERALLEAELQSSRAVLAELSTSQKEIQARLAEKETQLAGKQKTLELLAGEILTVEETIEQERTLIEDHRAKRALAETARLEQEGQSEGIASRQKELEQSRLGRVERLNQLNAEIAGHLAHLDVIESAERDLIGYASGAQLLIKAARDLRLRGGRGVLGGLLQVPESLEIAIAAALGEYLDAFVLEDDSSLDLSLAELEGKHVRAALLPLKTLQGRPKEFRPNFDSLGLDGADGVVGLASRLIDVPQEMGPMADLLLGDAILVADRAAARSVLRVLSKQDGFATWRVVTLNGEIHHSHGAVLLAQEGKPGTLSRPRERRDLTARIKDLRSQSEQADRELEAIQHEIQVAAAEQEQAESLLSDLREEARSLDKADLERQLRLDQALLQLERYSDQQRQLQEEILEEVTLIENMQRQLEDFSARILLGQSALDERLACLTDLPVEELQAGATHWQVQSNAAEHSYGQAVARLEERQRLVEQAELALASLKDQISETEQAWRLLEKERGELVGSEQELNLEIEALRAQIDPLEGQLAVLESQQLSAQESETRARQELNLAEHHAAQAKIALVRKQEALDGLRRRIEDDFGLVAFEYAQEVSGPTPLPLEGMVEELPKIAHISPEFEESIKRQKAVLRRMGPINPEAQVEYREVKDRYDFMVAQVKDLQNAEQDVRQVITRLDELMQQEFQKTFKAVAEEFRQIFSRMFGGGSARLVLTDPDDITHTGIDIEARLPGRREQGLSLLSGGERSLTAVSLVFAILRVAPTPFCVLDEVDAMLDEANVGRFRELLKELSQTTQFILITHNRNTVQVADVLYGVTMGRDSSTQMVSLKMDEVDRVVE